MMFSLILSLDSVSPLYLGESCLSSCKSFQQQLTLILNSHRTSEGPYLVTYPDREAPPTVPVAYKHRNVKDPSFHSHPSDSR
ncbi:hypothetical protein JZ751_005625, partial [Albula glossodonta]